MFSVEDCGTKELIDLKKKLYKEMVGEIEIHRHKPEEQDRIEQTYRHFLDRIDNIVKQRTNYEDYIKGGVS